MVMVQPKSREEIESHLRGKGDFVQIDYLDRSLRYSLGVDLKKFVMVRLAGLYEKVNMVTEAAKYYSNVAELSTTFSEKRELFMKEFECYVRANIFARSDIALKKAMNEGNVRETKELKERVKGVYLRVAQEHDSKNRKGQALHFYERVLQEGLSEGERQQVKMRLLALYRDLGKIREYGILQRELGINVKGF